MHNKSLQWILVPLRSAKTSELKRWTGSDPPGRLPSEVFTD
ncbi:MAG: hypothetical protein SCK70_06240 [bacterium]|nr:hypothetical protein [bacterium]